MRESIIGKNLLRPVGSALGVHQSLKCSKVSGDMAGWGKKVSKTQIEALAVAECMTNNEKEKCFIYAINDEVVWK